MRLRKQLFAFVLASCAGFHAINAQTVSYVSGVIEKDSIWNSDTVKVIGDIEVNQNVTLTIEAGTYIKLMGYYEINIRGIINASGTALEPIVFSVDDTTGFSNVNNTDGSWSGLFITNSYSSDTSRLSHCTFKYAKELNNSHINEMGGALIIEFTSRVVVSDCLFSNNISYKGGALRCHGFIEPVIQDCVFEFNRSISNGGAIILYGSSPLIINNTFRNNISGNGGTISCENQSQPVIRSNIFTRNYAQKGAVMYISYSGGIIANNHIVNNYGNYSAGISCYGKSVPRIINNIISNNQGSGIYLSQSSPEILNNTICNNFTDRGGIHSSDANPRVVNTIIYGNGTVTQDYTVHCEGTLAFPDFYHCDIAGLQSNFTGTPFTGKFENIIDEDPLFVLPTPGKDTLYNALEANWELQDNSPCINQGDPGSSGFELPNLEIYGNERILHGQIDIGASEKYIPSITAEGTISSDTKWTADTVLVTENVDIQDDAVLTIPAGTVVIFQGYYHINVMGTLLAEGKDNERVRFTIKDTTGFSYADSSIGAWEGIYLNNGPVYTGGVNGAMNDNLPSSFSFCIFEYSKKWDMSDLYKQNGGVFNTRGIPYLLFDHCVFRYNSSMVRGGALHIEDTDLEIKGSEFYGNKGDYGGCINLVNANGLIKESLFHHNNGISQAGCIYNHYSDLRIERTIMANNDSWSEGAMFSYGGTVELTNCIVSNNQGRSGGIGVEVATLNITNSSIINNLGTTFAGGLDFRGSKGRITNTVIRGNQVYGKPEQVKLQDDYSDPDFINCNIQGGSGNLKVNPGNSFDGLYLDCIDADPEFANPSGGIGSIYDGLNANWSILDISPNINAGSTDTSGLNTLQVDFTGNPRFNYGIIDIGAVENQGTIPTLIKQPEGKALCTGNNISLSALAADTVRYQWQRDGEDIPGKTSFSLNLNSVSLFEEGNYRCLIENRYGKIFSNSVYIPVKAPPVIQAGPTDQWIQPGSKVDLEVYTNGSGPFSFNWYRNDSILADALAPVYSIRQAGAESEGHYICHVSNSCGRDSSDLAALYLAPQICMVTVSQTTGHNLIVWEKKSIAPIMAYNIYRESVAAGIYDRLATISYDDLSVLTDTFADPTMQAYLYKITALDTAGAETDIDLCKPHKTVHLIVSTNPELKSTQLQWDRYYGFDYQTYTIYKSSTGVNFDPEASISASLNSWTDPVPLAGDQFYRIAVEKPDPCIPVGGDKKAGTGPYHHSLSNMDDNKLKAGQLPPDTITLSRYSIEEEKPPGTMIGKLFTLDGDSIDSHTYQFVQGEGDRDNISFTLLGDLLLASESYDYEIKNQYLVRIRSTDQAGGYCEVPMIINITDVDETTGLPVLNAGAVKAFPNPFSQSTTISFPNQAGELFTMFLIDLTGKIVRIETDIFSSEIILKRGELEKGIYLVELRGNKTLHGKIVIR